MSIWLTFIIVSFCLALVLILSKNSLHPTIRPYLAIFALVMVLISFGLIISSFFGFGPA